MAEQAYGAFAQAYDRMMGVRGEYDWPGEMSRLVSAHGIVPPMRILDVGCGTGHCAIALAKQGYRVYASDRSHAMLAQAQKAAQGAGISLPLFQADMTDLPRDVRYHALTATCDPVNYLESEQAVRAFFLGAHRSLYRGGVLLFDVCTPHYYQTVLGGGTFGAAQDDSAYLLTTQAVEDGCEMQLTLFVQQHNGAYARHEEVHRLYAYEREQLAQWLLEAGFQSAKAYRFGSDEGAEDEDERWQLIATA